MPTNRRKKRKFKQPKPEHKKIIVNGEEVEPCKKGKVPPDFDWQKLARERSGRG